jgi:hypothetical protein
MITPTEQHTTLNRKRVIHLLLAPLLSINLLLLPASASSQYYDRCRTPRDLVFLIDHSGTMNYNDPEGLRWAGLRQLIRRLATGTDRSDRLLFIPFGSAKDTKNYLTKHGALGWFKLHDRRERDSLFTVLNGWAKERKHSDSTDIFAAFETFARRFYPSRQRTSDLYIFFISDGRMDVGNPQRGAAYRAQAIKNRDRQVFELLHRFQNLWRIYSICVGRRVDEARHQKILSYSKNDRRRSGLPYPPLGHTSPGQPYYLRVNEGDGRSNLALLKDSIWDALDIGGAELYRGHAGKTGLVFPTAAPEDFRFHFSLAQPVPANEFLERINLSYRIDKEFFPARLLAEHQGPDHEATPYLDYRVDIKALARLGEKQHQIKDIREWKIEIGELPRDQNVVSLQIVQRHGWRVYIDSLFIEPEPRPRKILDRLVNAPQPCGATLWVSGWAYNECGPQNISAEDQLILHINNGKTYQMKIERERTYDQVTKEPSFIYYWQPAEVITEDPAFPGRLGATVSLGLRLSAFGGYLYQNHSIAVPACAEYEGR